MIASPRRPSQPGSGRVRGFFLRFMIMIRKLAIAILLVAGLALSGSVLAAHPGTITKAATAQTKAKSTTKHKAVIKHHARKHHVRHHAMKAHAMKAPAKKAAVKTSTASK